ncbi:MAG: vitamin K epoxide reductase family protein [Nanoarchaeota archaeon]|nr:vitamin K epoxide reductase family protein [Nanoarchaeota archaeon]
MDQKKGLLWIRIIAILAILLSSLLVYEHYKTTPSEFCTFGESFDCDLVNKSAYSTIDGIFYFLSMDLGLHQIPLFYIPIPLSLMGILVFLFVLLSAHSINNKKNLFGIKPKNQIKVLKWLMVLSILLALYLIYIEKFILLMWCIYCLGLDILIVISAILIMRLK